MKSLSIELPEKLAAELKRYVKAGWFGSEAEVVQTVLREFIRRNRIELMEGFLKEDISWARKVIGTTRIAAGRRRADGGV